MLKLRTALLMSLHDAPEHYWDYAVEFITHMAVECLKWRTPYEKLIGVTLDVLVFRFILYEPIYYMDPNVSFPHPNMLSGRFLEITRTIGDSFTFYILTD